MATAMEVSGDFQREEDDDIPPQATLDQSTGRTAIAIPGERLDDGDTAGWIVPRKRAAQAQRPTTQISRAVSPFQRFHRPPMHASTLPGELTLHCRNRHACPPAYRGKNTKLSSDRVADCM